MGSTHRMFGALTGTAYAAATGMPPAQAAAFAALATVTSSGPSWTWTSTAVGD